MDANRYHDWLSEYGERWSLGAFFSGAEGEPYKQWREVVTPLIIAESTRLNEDFSAFKARLDKVDLFLGGLHGALLGVWQRFKNDGTTDRDKTFDRPRHWWTHFNLGHYFQLGTKTAIEHVEVNEDEVVQFATEYLSMPWLRHPRLDWLFIDALLFFPTFDAVRQARLTLAQQALYGDQAKFSAALERGNLSELKWQASKGRFKSTLLVNAFAWGVGLVAPLVALVWLASSRVAEWVAWVVAVPSVLLLLLTAWSVLWWFIGVIRRALGGKDTRPESASKLAKRLEDQAQAWLAVYDLLSASAIPVDTLRQKVAQLPPLPNGKTLPPALSALLARVAEKDGAVWVPFPR
jgi:hypothetical protein